MARRRLLENQLFEGKSWHGFTTKNHLVNAFDLNTTHIADKITQLYDVNLGEDFVSMIQKHGTYTIPAGKDEYQWKLDSVYDTFYEVVGAYEDYAGSIPAGTSAGFLAGANRTRFYMDFVGKPFSNTETIVGERPDTYTIRIASTRDVGGDVTRYEVELVTSGPDEYIPIEEITIGTRWSSEAGAVTDTLADDGFDIGFRSKTMLNGFLSTFRMKHVIPGNMFNVKPMGFFIKGKDGKAQQMWITNVEYEFLRKARYATAAIIMNGKSNRWADGSYGNYDKNGFAVKMGSGFREQWASSNKYVYNKEPDLDFLTEIALDATVGKVNPSNRKMVIRAGEYGIMELGRMVQRKLGSDALKQLSYLGDTTGRAFKWTGNDLKVNLGQFRSVAVINNIEFYFMVDPLKDDPKRNKLEHPKGGLASSYEYDIMGFGSQDEKSNMQIVRREGESPIYGVEEGMRGFMSGKGSSFMNPKQLSSGVDGSTIHYQDFGVGAIVWDPTKVIQYHPEILQ